MDQGTRKLMTIHKALHPRDDIDRLNMSRKEERRGLASIEDSGDASIQWLEDNIKKCVHWLQPPETILIIQGPTERQKLEKNGKKTTLCAFKRLISNISHEKTWTWLRKGNHKRETESLLIVAQNNAIRSNHIKARIDDATKLKMLAKWWYWRNDQSHNKWMLQTSTERV